MDDPRGCGFGTNCKDCTLLSAIEDTFKTGNPHKDIEYEMTKDNNRQKFYLSGSTALIKSANPDNLLLLCLYDITARKQAELDISQKNKELQKINATKDKFFSIISHDLKSPFHSIVGFSEVLVEKAKENDYDGIGKYAGIILQSSERALDLLSNLMEWSRSQTGRIEFNPSQFDFSQFIDEILLLFEDIARQKAIVIKSETPPNAPVSADPAMINTVMRNLISNALKFTKPGGEIIITLSEKPLEIIVSVKDNGIGISADRMDKLFRLDESYSTPGTNNEKGTGLGLILCKEFVEKHGGTIWVESELDLGSVFSFSIPLIK